jgi:hypothetical protein
MSRFRLAFFLSLLGVMAYSQNDLDAIRYARIGGGGSSRFISMGGAFGAVGADLTTAAYNPAGLALFRKGEIAFSTGFKTTSNTGRMHGNPSNVMDLNLVYNNFGLAAAWKSTNDEESRHAIAFTSTQHQNFRNSVRMSGYTNSGSIAKDMLNLASYYDQSGNMTGNLNPMYEGLGYQSYLLDIDSVDMKFFSFLDPKRTVKQTRDIVTSGKVNDLNFSYAYSFKDKFYLGLSLGVPQLSYESTTTHTEIDDRDSMRIAFNDTSFTDTYVDFLPVAYYSRLGFHDLEYTEYFKTTGSGLNLKLGGIIRVTESLRLGFYYHTPTLYRLQDTYYNEIYVAFDRNPSQRDHAREPWDGGFYQYRIITPSKLSANAAFIFKKLAVFALDYEFVNYRTARLASDNISDFEQVNAQIMTKYKGGHNLRLGAELNMNPFMVRLGYNMQGSPFGEVFAGDFVRNTFSTGVGIRTKSNFYFDFVLYRNISNENYYLFTTLDTGAKLRYTTTTLAATIGVKF